MQKIVRFQIEKQVKMKYPAAIVLWFSLAVSVFPAFVVKALTKTEL